MANIRTSSDSAGDSQTGEDRLRDVDDVASKTGRDPNARLRVGEREDTVYDDGLELETDDEPLTAPNGVDDSGK